MPLDLPAPRRPCRSSGVFLKNDFGLELRAWGNIGLYRDNGKENGNCYLGFRVEGLRLLGFGFLGVGALGHQGSVKVQGSQIKDSCLGELSLPCRVHCTKKMLNVFSRRLGSSCVSDAARELWVSMNCEIAVRPS